MSTRRLSRRLLLPSAGALFLALLFLTAPDGHQQLFAQGAQQLVPGRNVNMVAGTKWPDGDPYLQRQNEPSVAASTRNPLHMLAGANDYRTVDIPNPSDGDEETGDAWLGIFKSFDGGQRWQTTLLPGYPQDGSPEGLASPLKGYQAGADPVVRAGTNGLFYYAGLVFDRGDKAKSAIFVARFIDNNNVEDNYKANKNHVVGDPVSYLGAGLVARNNGSRFYDKPWIVVDIPRSSRTCQIPGPNGTIEQIPAGDVYVAFSSIDEDAKGLRSDIMLSRSSDCGATWSQPIRISDPSDRINQGATMAIDPRNGTLHVAWRRFASTVRTQTDGIVAVQSTDGGRRFSAPGICRAFASGRGRKEGLDPERYFEHRRKATQKPKIGRAVDVAAEVDEFDQATDDINGFLMFRTNAYPTMAIDGDGRVYLAWSERGLASPPAQPGDARVVISTSTNGRNWTTPRAVADLDTPTGTATPQGQPGHQIMPSLAVGGGKLVLVYYDLREDITGQFTPFVDDKNAITLTRRRHTLDLRASVGLTGPMPVFGPSVQVSDYLTTLKRSSATGAFFAEQSQYNPPNLPMFKKGTAPFIGDYVDVAVAPAFVPAGNGRWKFNTNGAPPAFHAVWTDNRDVRQPGEDTNGDGNPWNDYTPPTQRTTSVFDPTKGMPSCSALNTGSRNQNIYTSRLSLGLVAGSPGNAKPLKPDVQRAFVVYAQNTTSVIKAFELKIVDQPAGGRASFRQFDPLGADGKPVALTTLRVTTPARSTAARSVYATSSIPNAQIQVSVTEVPYNGTISLVPLSDVVILNPDIANPDIANPDIANLGIATPDIANAEVYNPDIANPDIANPDIANPDIANPDIANPDIANPDIANPDIANPDIANPDIANPDIANVTVANPDIANPDIANPDIANPDIANPDIANPDIANPDIANASLTDVTWTMTNKGNTTAAFNVNLFLSQAAGSKICTPAQTPGANQCIATQLVLRKLYSTPTTDGCELKVQTQNVLVASIDNPKFVMPNDGLPDQNDDSEKNATLWLAPGETAKITLRVHDPNRFNNVGVPDGDSTTPTDPNNLVIDPIFLPTTTSSLGSVTPVVQQQGVDTQDKGIGSTVPPIVTPLSPPIPSGGNDPAPTPLTLSFVQQPTTNLPAGDPIAPSVTVLVNDQYGHPLANAPVALYLGTNPSAATLSYAPVLSGEGGIAIFPDLKVSVNGEGYTLVATAGQALPAVSNPFNAITPCDRLVVTSTGDTADCGTLRAAITEANSHEGLDTITFNIPGAVPHVIAPLTPLPAISEAVVIDGTSDPHYELDLEPAISIDGNAVAGEGLQLMAGASTIKGLNIIRFHGANGYAIHVLAAAGGSVIEKNFIGTDRTHAPGLGNIVGVRLNYPNTVTVRDNTISGNAAEGILLIGGTGNVIKNNFIGTVPGGLSAVPNRSNGITLYDGSQNTVIRDNVISGNGIGLPGEANRWGIEIQQSGGLAFVAGTQFLHNTIGLSSAGAALPNLSGGISANAAGVTIIGTPADGNVIAGNSGIGVLVIAGTATIRGNSIYDNDGIGIDLGADGVTVNDPGDGDAGPNGLQNSPVLSNATTAGVDFALSAPDPNYTYEFFSSPACDPTGFGEGRTLLGSWTAGPTGTAMFSLDAAVGSFITATATDASGNTSEFSNCIPVPGPLTSVITSASPQPVAAGFGQMLTVRGTNLQATAAGDVLFSQGGGEVAASYMWGANSTMAIVRLPETLTPGLPTSVRLKNGPGTAFSNSFPITVSLTPGAPVLAALLGACNTGTETNVTSVSSGQQVYVLADGVDSSGTTFVWTSPLGTVLTTPGSSTTGGSGGGVCTATSAPTFIEGGSWTLQIRVTVGSNTSPLSNSIPVSAGTSSPGTAWSGTGSGVVTILNDGTATGQPQMQYQANGYPVFSGNWSFSTVAPATETVNLTFAWSGGHGPYFMAATGLDVFVNRGGADVSVATLVNDGAWPCCVPPSLMFEYAGATSVAVQAGDTYGFRLRGSHYDGSYILQGTFGVKVGGTPQFAVNVRGTAGGTELDAYSIPRPVRVFGGTLAAGQQVVVTAAGMVTRATGALPNGPAGDGGTCNSGCLAPDLSPLALVARIGGGPWQLVGAGPTVLTATSPGLLEFGVNDDYFPDNSGGFIATVSWVAAPPH